jgi:hypothetical protein
MQKDNSWSQPCENRVLPLNYIPIHNFSFPPQNPESLNRSLTQPKHIHSSSSRHLNTSLNHYHYLFYHMATLQLILIFEMNEMTVQMSLKESPLELYFFDCHQTFDFEIKNSILFTLLNHINEVMR